MAKYIEAKKAALFVLERFGVMGNPTMEQVFEAIADYEDLHGIEIDTPLSNNPTTDHNGNITEMVTEQTILLRSTKWSQNSPTRQREEMSGVI